MSASGYAEFTPVATNATKSGRAKNRRVELHFLGKKKEKKSAISASILDKPQAK